MTQQIRVQANIGVPESVIRDGIDVADLGLTLIGREYTTSLGRIDIFTVDASGAPVPIEVKLGEAGDSAVGQVLGYMSAVGASRGVIVAKSFSKRVEAISKAASIGLVQYVVAPSEEVVVSNTPTKQTLAHASFDDAVLNRTHQDHYAEEAVKTSVNLPYWMYVSLELLHLEEDITTNKLYTGIVNHGTAIVQHRFGDELDAQRQIRSKILRSDDEHDIGYLLDFKVLGNKTFANPRKRTVAIPDWCVEYLRRFSGVFPINYSTVIRLSMMYSLLKWEHITERCRTNCAEETEAFERGLNKYLHVVNGM